MTVPGIVAALGGPHIIRVRRRCTVVAIINWHADGFPPSLAGNFIEPAQ